MTKLSSLKPYALIVLVTVGAFAIRVPELSLRPMHGDEANQAHKTGILIEDGVYEYDPHDHHGPTLYYLARINAAIAGQSTYVDTTEVTYRIVPVIFGTLLIIAGLLLVPGVPRSSITLAGLFVAVSPAFSFYSRYFIQEMLLVVFTVTAIGFGYQYLRKPSYRYGIALGASLSLMHATKETAAIAVLSMLAGLAGLAWVYRAEWRNPDSEHRLQWKHVAAGVAVGLAINILLFTAFFTNGRGPLDSILTYGNYLQRADGAGLHDKPWHYYLKLLLYIHKGPGGDWFSEGFVVITGIVTAIGATTIGWKRKASPLLLFLSVYTLTSIIIYSLIPYKTPWSMLSFYHGITLLSAFGCVTFVGWLKPMSAKITASLVIAGAVLHLSYQGHIVNRELPADPQNPYVYAHTSSAFLRLVETLDGLDAAKRDDAPLRIYIIQPDGDYWPMPWYFRKYQAGFFPNIPPDFNADVIIAAPNVARAIQPDITENFRVDTAGLRPSVLRAVFVNRELWDAYMQDRV